MSLSRCQLLVQSPPIKPTPLQRPLPLMFAIYKAPVGSAGADEEPADGINGQGTSSPYYVDTDLTYAKVRVKPSSMIRVRNILAAQCALVRGDRLAILHNADCLPTNEREQLRPVLPDGARYDQRHYSHVDIPMGSYWEQRTTRARKPSVVDDILNSSNNWNGFELEWVDMLGEGGFGLATLWEATFEDGERLKIVIKMGRPGSDFRADSESDWHREYSHSEHTVQLVDLPAIVAKKRAQNPGQQRILGTDFVPEDHNIMVLEYARFGSLSALASKLSTEHITIPTRILWDIWDCRKYLPSRAS